MTLFWLASSPIDTSLVARRSSFVPSRHTDGALSSRAPAAGPAPLVLELIDNRLAFNALELEWTALFERAGRPQQLFQSFGWLWHWCNHFLTPQDRKTSLAVVTGRRNGVLVLGLPLILTRSQGLSSVTFMGDPVSQYGDGLVEDSPWAEGDLRAAFDFLLRRTAPDYVHLRKVRSDSALLPLLGERGALFTDVQQAPYVAFEGVRGYEIFAERYTKSARKNRKRQLRRLQEIGATAFERLTAGDDAGEAVGVALRLKREWLRQRGLVSSAVTDTRTEAFFRACVSGRGPATGVEVGTVTCGGKVAAIEIAIQCKTRTAIHLIAYDQRFEKTGAGALLMEDSLRRACQSGKEALDLLAPGAAYKFEWADRSVEVKDCAIGLSALGKAYAALYLGRVRPTAKGLIAQLPATVRRRFASVASIAF